MAKQRMYNGQEYLTVKDLMARWDLKEQTLNNWRYQDKGPKYSFGIVPGKRIVYFMKDVLAYEKALALGKQLAEDEGDTQ